MAANGKISGLSIQRKDGVPTDAERPYQPRGACLELFYTRSPEVLIEGPANCVAPETRIYEPLTGEYTPIWDLFVSQRAPIVQTVFGPVQAEIPFVKGVACLYRVTLESGQSFIATAGHRLLTASGWQFVGEHLLGESIPVSFPALPGRYSGPYLSENSEGGDRWKKTESGYSDCYSADCRHCDVQLPVSRDIGPSVVPLSGDVLVHSRVGRNAGGHFVKLEYNRPYPLSCRLSNVMHFLLSGQTVSVPPRVLGYTSQRAAYLSQDAVLFRTETDPHVPTDEALDCGDNTLLALLSSYNPYYTVQQSTVSRVEFERVGVYLDVHVPGAEHYLAEGVWHHNTGKSRAALEKLHLCCLKYPGMRAAILRKTRESLTQTALVTYEQRVMVPPESIHFHHEDQEYQYPNGSRVIVAGLDKPEKILSSEYDIVYIQEATEAVENDIEIVITRLRNGVMPYQQLIMDCNPNDPNHWLNQRCIRNQTVRLLSKHSDNPTVTPEYLAMLDGLTGFRRLRLRDGIWAGAEGQFFEEWNPDIHICRPFSLPSDWVRWVAIDYGYADPFCALWFARDSEDKYNIYVYREAYGVGLRDVRQAKLIKSVVDKAKETIQWYVADPACFNKRTEQERPSIARVYWQNGLRPLAPGINKRVLGWAAVRNALAKGEEKGRSKPRLQIFSGRCPNLVRTLPSMVADPLNSEDLADKIKGVKTEDHAVDALRYGLMLEAMPEAEKVILSKFKFV